MSKSKYYVVRKGRKPGIYDNWADCESQVKGYAGNEYKSFSLYDDAVSFFNGIADESSLVHSYDDLQLPRKVKSLDVYVDGSYNSNDNTYGYGVYIDDGCGGVMLYGRGPCQFGGRNIEGEIASANKAMDYIVENYKDCSHVVMHHDYMGISGWGTGQWGSDKLYVLAYQKHISDFASYGIKLEFDHVNGHTGVKGNELVDKLAKLGCGVDIGLKDFEFIKSFENAANVPKDKVVCDIDMSESNRIASFINHNLQRQLSFDFGESL